MKNFAWIKAVNSPLSGAGNGFGNKVRCVNQMWKALIKLHENEG